MAYDEIHIGNHAFGKGQQRAYLKDSKRAEHCHIIGSTGTGKSKLMEHMIRQDIRNGKGICLIDPHGTLYSAVLKWAVANGYDHRLVVIDPTQAEWAVGLNFFEYNPAVFDLGQHVSEVIAGIGKARNEDIFATSHVVLWLRNFLQLACQHRLTPFDVCELLDDQHRARRDSLTEEITDDPVLRMQLMQAWREYDAAPKGTRYDFMRAPVFTRMQTFLSTRTMRRIVGHTRSTVDFDQAIEKGQIVLVNLHGKLAEEEQRLLGIMVIDKLFQAAMRRPPDQGQPYYVYVDEFGNFISERIARALEELRKRRVCFTLAHQQLEQLQDDQLVGGRRLLSAVMTNTKVKIAFRISRRDAEEMAMEMFAGFITGDEIKHEQKVTTPWPVKTRDTVYVSGESVSDSDINSIMESVGSMTGSHAGKVFVPEAGFLGIDELATYSTGAMSANSSTTGTGHTTGRTVTYSGVEIDVPSIDFEAREQVVSTTFYSIEEIKERYIQFLQNQAERFFHLRVMGETERRPLPLQTADVAPTDLLPSVQQAALQKALARSAVPSQQIDELYEARMEALLAAPRTPEEEDNFKYNAHDVERYRQAPVTVQKGRRKPR